jgi:hypothetical protein
VHLFWGEGGFELFTIDEMLADGDMFFSVLLNEVLKKD